MSLKKFKPVTPAQRGLVLVDRSELSKKRPEKSLTKRLVKTGGRNNLGRITCRHKGGGHKRLYRMVDFKRSILDQEATVIAIEYDPNRTAFIALIEYADKTKSYMLAPNNLKVGDKIISSLDADIKPGNSLPLKNIPIGTVISNIEMKPGKGGQIARSAGTSAVLAAKDSGYAQLKLPSGRSILILLECFAMIGSLSNPDQKNINVGKAGRSRRNGIRPTVRGVAMNPVDHPHGGGEGKTSGGRHPVSPWSQPTKGKKTRKNKRTDRYIIK